MGCAGGCVVLTVDLAGFTGPTWAVGGGVVFVAIAMHAPGQQPAYGAQAQQGYGYQDPQTQQQPFDGNGAQYGQDQQQYGQDEQAPGQDEQCGQDEQKPNGAEAPGPKGVQTRVGLDETADHEGEAEAEPAEEHEEVGAAEHEPSKAVGAGHRQFPQDPNDSKLMSHFHVIAVK
ncbi:hypothetical protein LTR36_008049 [Oleoguttula mirabilis]|uniref:Uncharacterized protein n=1 Tax=Oleoguttula mirabilis TaxID=1507867 RepID=A0AAV9J9M3_9PEZI|nr:hypothetical protein LTR36_008049 [Oleoguttula mirabilis]